MTLGISVACFFNPEYDPPCNNEVHRESDIYNNQQVDFQENPEEWQGERFQTRALRFQTGAVRFWNHTTSRGQLSFRWYSVRRSEREEGILSSREEGQKCDRNTKSRREVREQERETEEQWKNMMQISERTTYGRLMGSLWSEWTCRLCLLSWLKHIVYWILHSIHLYSHPAIRRANTKGSIAPQRNANVNLFVHFCHICAQCMFKHTHTSGLQARHQVC